MKLRTLLLLALLPVYAFAGVNLKNGNFYVTYTDVIVPGGGHDLEITRTYNSKAPDTGWFGIGWGSDFETKLIVSPDGSVVVHENGTGAMTRFTPKGSINPEMASKKIVDAMRSKGALLSEKVAADMVEKLNKDSDLRLVYAKKYGVVTSVPSGTVLYSNERGIQEVHKTKDGYMRVLADGKKEFFSEEGKLSKIMDKGDYQVDFEYKSGQLVSIKDSMAKQLFFEWYPNGRVKSVWSKPTEKATYKYSDRDLIESKDVSGNLFAYGYDANHNLTAIKYEDGKEMKITYDPKMFLVTKVQEKDGTATEYKYGANPQNPDLHYWTEVIKTDSENKKLSNRYEYEIKTRPDGSNYTYRVVTDIGSEHTETVYSECCGLPLKIVQGKDVTSFEYNEKGLLTKKSSSKGEFVQLEYHPKFNKVTKVVNGDGWTQFKYDDQGNLARAENNKGQAVVLLYDRKGRIQKMVDFDKSTNKKRALEFKYNTMDKPVEIAMESVGKINVAYDDYGEIKKVESAAGHQMALQVTQAFQSLLTIVKPAGVNLNM